MEKHLLGLKTSFCTEGLVAFRGSLILTHPIPPCAVFCSFQLSRNNGILTFPSVSKMTSHHLPMRRMTSHHLPMMMSCLYQLMSKTSTLHQPIRSTFFPWQNTSTIAFTFTPLRMSLNISFLLASSFRSMCVKLGLLQNKSAFLSSKASKISLGWRSIRAWLMLWLLMLTLTWTIWAGASYSLHHFLVVPATCSSNSKMPWPSIATLEVVISSLP